MAVRGVLALAAAGCALAQPLDVLRTTDPDADEPQPDARQRSSASLPHRQMAEDAASTFHDRVLRHIGIDIADVLEGLRDEFEGRRGQAQTDTSFNCGAVVGSCVSQIFKDKSLALGVDMRMRECDYKTCDCAQGKVNSCNATCAKDDEECRYKCGLSPLGPIGGQISELLLRGSDGKPLTGQVLVDCYRHAKNSSFPCFHPPGEGPEMAFDGLNSTKWLDTGSSQDSLIIGFATQQPFYDYAFVTGNDAPERDPIAWAVYTADSATGPWSLCGGSAVGTHNTTMERGAAIEWHQCDGCRDAYDDQNGPGQCQYVLDHYTNNGRPYSCDLDFCPTCKLAGYCDKLCKFCTSKPKSATHFRFQSVALRERGTCRPWLINETRWKTLNPLNPLDMLSADDEDPYLKCGVPWLSKDDWYCYYNNRTNKYCDAKQGNCNIQTTTTTLNKTQSLYVDRYQNALCPQMEGCDNSQACVIGVWREFSEAYPQQTPVCPVMWGCVYEQFAAFIENCETNHMTYDMDGNVCNQAPLCDGMREAFSKVPYISSCEYDRKSTDCKEGQHSWTDGCRNPRCVCSDPSATPSSPQPPGSQATPAPSPARCYDCNWDHAQALHSAYTYKEEVFEGCAKMLCDYLGPPFYVGKCKNYQGTVETACCHDSEDRYSATVDDFSIGQKRFKYLTCEQAELTQAVETFCINSRGPQKFLAMECWDYAEALSWEYRRDYPPSTCTVHRADMNSVNCSSKRFCDPVGTAVFPRCNQKPVLTQNCTSAFLIGSGAYPQGLPIMDPLTNLTLAPDGTCKCPSERPLCDGDGYCYTDTPPVAPSCCEPGKCKTGLDGQYFVKEFLAALQECSNADMSPLNETFCAKKPGKCVWCPDPPVGISTESVCAPLTFECTVNIRTNQGLIPYYFGKPNSTCPVALANVTNSTPAPPSAPTTSPGASPTSSPTIAPAASPSASPLAQPSLSPAKAAAPSAAPMTPSQSPKAASMPTASPVSTTGAPAAAGTPTAAPAAKGTPTAPPVTSPTASPATSPTASPATSPTTAPHKPGSPTAAPAKTPATTGPSSAPSASPVTGAPTAAPDTRSPVPPGATHEPSSTPTTGPSPGTSTDAPTTTAPSRFDGTPAERQAAAGDGDGSEDGNDDSSMSVLGVFAILLSVVAVGLFAAALFVRNGRGPVGSRAIPDGGEDMQQLMLSRGGMSSEAGRTVGNYSVPEVAADDDGAVKESKPAPDDPPAPTVEEEDEIAD
eukprot:TRINITY_DN650_c0_g1_i1.p1 TRINITY_DN650_c0_g1~~TRINITY_DN650_c0_g1_i1.p1  ORF type:complete len:1241 (+),score=326.60 TRINITY_DN650_c0_g1_i1:57-3779(+)